jgi:two-component system cell cycle sensor histidine kinase/response regulator CckA
VIHEAIKRGERYEVVYRIRREDNQQVRWLLERGKQVEPGWLEGFVMDITEQHMAQAQLALAQRMEAIGHLARGIAHEFNNMVAVIGAHADFLAEDLAAGEAVSEEDVAAIRSAAELASALVKQLMLLGKPVTTRMVVNPVQALQSLTQLLRRTLGASVTLRFVAAPDVSPVLLNEGQLEQIVLNLALNARDAMPEGGALLIELADVVLDQINAQRVRLHPGHYVQLSVSDTGAGIPDAELSRIFDPFFTTRPEGTGLGLPTIYQILSNLGGGVIVQSEVGRGTRFTMYIPAHSPKRDRG